MTYTLFPTLAAAEARVPVGKLFTVRVPEPAVRLCLVREATGGWRAFLDACPHKLAALSQGGFINTRGEVICPLHNYAFELATGQETTGQSCPALTLYKVTIDDMGLHVQVN